MLAEHLHQIRRRGTPEKYARDADVEAAIRNYLAIALRANRTPGLLLGHPAAPEMAQHTMQDLVETHDPAALMALMDQLNERGYPWSRSALMDQLTELHAHISGHRQDNDPALVMPHPAVVRGYGEEGLANHEVGNFVSRRATQSQGGAIPPLQALQGLLHFMNLHQPEHEQRHPLAAHLHELQHGNAMSTVSLHDIIGGLIQSPSSTPGVRGRARMIQPDAQRLLQDLHPALWHYGETGQLPQG